MSQFNTFDQGSLCKLPPEGVMIPGQYGDSGHIPRLTINSRGVIVGVELVPFTSGGGTGEIPTPGQTDFDTTDFADEDFLT